MSDVTSDKKIAIVESQIAFPAKYDEQRVWAALTANSFVLDIIPGEKQGEFYTGEVLHLDLVENSST